MTLPIPIIIAGNGLIFRCGRRDNTSQQIKFRATEPIMLTKKTFLTVLAMMVSHIFGGKSSRDID